MIGTGDAGGDVVGAEVDVASGPHGRPVEARVHSQDSPTSFLQAAQPWSFAWWPQGPSSLRK